MTILATPTKANKNHVTPLTKFRIVNKDSERAYKERAVNFTALQQDFHANKQSIVSFVERHTQNKGDFYTAFNLALKNGYATNLTKTQKQAILKALPNRPMVKSLNNSLSRYSNGADKLLEVFDVLIEQLATAKSTRLRLKATVGYVGKLPTMWFTSTPKNRTQNNSRIGYYSYCRNSHLSTMPRFNDFAKNPLAVRFAETKLGIVKDFMEQKGDHFNLDLDYFNQSILTADQFDEKVLFQKVGVFQDKITDWKYYSKSTRFPKTWVETTITYADTYFDEVYLKDLEFFSGLLTLHAQEIADIDTGAYPIKLYKAVWLGRGRGRYLTEHSGILAVAQKSELDFKPSFDLAMDYHAECDLDSEFDTNQAIAKAIKQLTIRLNKDRNAEKYAQQEKVDRDNAQFVAKALTLHRDVNPLECADKENLKQLTVKWVDCDNAGACHAGARSWCNSVGLDFTTGSVNLYAVVLGYVRNNDRQAIEVLEQALYRQRKSKAYKAVWHSLTFKNQPQVA